jgi:hypothetical protein
MVLMRNIEKKKKEFILCEKMIYEFFYIQNLCEIIIIIIIMTDLVKKRFSQKY